MEQDSKDIQNKAGRPKLKAKDNVVRKLVLPYSLVVKMASQGKQFNSFVKEAIERRLEEGW